MNNGANNKERRLDDNEGKMFFPRSIDGAVSDDGLLNSSKLITLLIIIAVNIFNYMYIKDDMFLSFTGKLARVFIVLFISQLVIRYYILNESYYYKLYKRMKNSKIVKPNEFWGIVAFNETSSGCIVNFDDGKSGVYVKLQRDSIIGKHANFKDTHYDAVSDFYNRINKLGYRIRKFDLMEPVGNDPRLAELDKLVSNCNNDNLKELLGIQVDYTKSITKVTMYESEYLLIHTSNYNSRGERIIGQIEDALECLLDGCYSGYTLLDKNEIEDVVKDIYGVNMFNSNNAMIELFKKSGNYQKTFNIVAIMNKDGTIIEMEKAPVKEKSKKVKKGKKQEENTVDKVNNVDDIENQLS